MKDKLSKQDINKIRIKITYPDGLTLAREFTDVDDAFRWLQEKQIPATGAAGGGVSDEEMGM